MRYTDKTSFIDDNDGGFRGVVLPIFASEVEKFGVEAESLRPVVYHRPLQQYGVDDTPWVSTLSSASM